jgi:hypothetical protein
MNNRKHLKSLQSLIDNHNIKSTNPLRRRNLNKVILSVGRNRVSDQAGHPVSNLLSKSHAQVSRHNQRIETLKCHPEIDFTLNLTVLLMLCTLATNQKYELKRKRIKLKVVLEHLALLFLKKPKWLLQPSLEVR